MRANIFNDDFRDFIRCFNQHDVEYILVGGYSVIIHGYPRTTGDMDIWVNKTNNNYHKIYDAFITFQMPVFDMTEEKFMGTEFDVFRFGIVPSRIDLMTNLLGLTFDDAFDRSTVFDDNGLSVKLIHINDLIAAKKASGRPRDLNDIENLEYFNSDR